MGVCRGETRALVVASATTRARLSPLQAPRRQWKPLSAVSYVFLTRRTAGQRDGARETAGQRDREDREAGQYRRGHDRAGHDVTWQDSHPRSLTHESTLIDNTYRNYPLIDKIIYAASQGLLFWFRVLIVVTTISSCSHSGSGTVEIPNLLCFGSVVCTDASLLRWVQGCLHIGEKGRCYIDALSML